MSISPIGFTPGLPSLAAMPKAAPVQKPTEDFGNVLAQGLERLETMRDTSDDLAVKAATGDLKDVHDYMIASTEASVATELTVAVSNKAVEAFTEIMRMQV